LISLAHNFLFVHIPKTAGNSIQNVLRTYSEDKIVCLAPHQDGIERFEVRSDKFNIHKHSTLQDYRAELGDEVFQRLFKFTSVRNPWDRMVSFYFSPHRGPVSWNREQFSQLIAQIPPVAAHVSLEGGSNSGPSCFNNMDYFIRYESLNDDFKKVCELIGIPWVPLPIRNKSKRQPYAIYYDDKLVELVRNRFSEEISYFGYEFDKNT
jgi:Sulfotransferase family